MKKYVFNILFFLGKLFSYVFPFSFFSLCYVIITKLYSGWLSRNFKDFGNSRILPPIRDFRGGKYIKIGNRTTLGKNIVLTAWDRFGRDTFTPQITIGDGCGIGDDAHITAINSITIGNNVLTGKKILITDNSHGESARGLLEVAPIKRPLYSKGPVIIEDNVWIGEKACIMPNVHIGKGSIIAANSVVTRDVPDYCVVAGIPAEIIKRVEE